MIRIFKAWCYCLILISTVFFVSNKSQTLAQIAEPTENLACKSRTLQVEDLYYRCRYIPKSTVDSHINGNGPAPCPKGQLIQVKDLYGNKTPKEYASQSEEFCCCRKPSDREQEYDKELIDPINPSSGFKPKKSNIDPEPEENEIDNSNNNDSTILEN